MRISLMWALPALLFPVACASANMWVGGPDSSEWTRLGGEGHVYDFERATGTSGYADFTLDDFDGALARSVVFTSEQGTRGTSNFGGTGNIGLSEVRFHTTELSRGMQWVRSHPFYISGLLPRPESFDMGTCREAGLNTLLAWKPRDGYYFDQAAEADEPWHYHIYEYRYGDTPEAVVDHVRGYLEQYPGCTGLRFGDEPQVSESKKEDRCPWSA